MMFYALILFQKWKQLLTPETARELAAIDKNQRNHYRAGLLDAVTSLATKLIRTNFILSPEKTKERREAAVVTIEKVTIQILKGESVIRRGDRYDPIAVAKIEGMQKEKVRTYFREKLAGTTVALTFFFGVLLYIAKHLTRDFTPTRQDLFFFVCNLIITILIIR